MELMGRTMSELGLTPVARARVAAATASPDVPVAVTMQFVSAHRDVDGVVRQTRIPPPDADAAQATEATTLPDPDER